MKRFFECACLLLLSLITLIGCGGSNNQNSSKSNVTSNTSAKINDNQAKTYNGWTTIKIDGEIEFQIPPTMEIQSGEYLATAQKIMPDFYKLVTQDGTVQRIVLQQKGLNEMKEDARARYARTIIKFAKESEKKYPSWGEELTPTKQELKEIEDIICNGPRPDETKLIQIIQHLEVKKINGIDCLNMKYETQYADNPIVINYMYMFFNQDRFYHLLIMYRSTEAEYWTAKDADIRDIVNTLKPQKT